MCVFVSVSVLHGVLERSWRSDRTWQRTQQGVLQLLSAIGLCLDCKHPADWLNEPLNCSRITDDTESEHSKQKQLHAIWVCKAWPLVKLQETNWKQENRRTVFLLPNSFLRSKIQTFPLFYQQIFWTGLNFLMTVDYFPKFLVVRLYNSHNFTRFWLSACGYFPNLRGSTRSDEFNLKYSFWLKL